MRSESSPRDRPDRARGRGAPYRDVSYIEETHSAKSWASRSRSREGDPSRSGLGGRRRRRDRDGPLLAGRGKIGGQYVAKAGDGPHRLSGANREGGRQPADAWADLVRDPGRGGGARVSPHHDPPGRLGSEPDPPLRGVEGPASYVAAHADAPHPAFIERAPELFAGPPDISFWEWARRDGGAETTLPARVNVTQTARRNWWDRNWKWSCPSAASPSCPPGRFVALVGSIGHRGDESSDAVRPRGRRGAEEPRGRGGARQPLREGLFVSGNVDVKGPSGTASLAIPCRARREKDGVRRGDRSPRARWTYSTLVVGWTEGGTDRPPAAPRGIAPLSRPPAGIRRPGGVIGSSRRG